MSARVGHGSVRSADGTAIAFESLGTGEGLILLGGALAASRDYLPLARSLAASFEVHLVERRGRGASGPQGPGYSVGREVEDLMAVQQATGARAVFGHSYGGLVALEAARASGVFLDVAVYEPGVSIGGSIPADWVSSSRYRLAGGDVRGAFAVMVRGGGFAPAALGRMPLWASKWVLRAAVRGERWERIKMLLASHLAEHEQLARLDRPTAARFGSVTARVLLLGGGESPSFVTHELFWALCATLPRCSVEMFDGLGHDAPSDTAPELVASVLIRHLAPGATSTAPVGSPEARPAT